MRELRAKAAVVGFGDAYTDEGCAASPMALATEAALKALADAGVERDEVDGLLSGREPFGDYRPQWNNIFAAHLKIMPRHSTQVTVHGAGVNGMFKHAVMAVCTGAADVVLCVQTDGGQAFSDLAEDIPAVDADPWHELPYGPSMAGFYAMAARRYMHEFGVTEEDFARAALTHQRWGLLHPLSERSYAGELTVDDVLESRIIATPLRRWMVAPWRRTGTAGAFVVTTAERARSLTSTPLAILGVGEYSTHENLSDRMSARGTHPVLGELPTLTTTGAKEAARQAYEMAGLTAHDVQVAETGSNFSHTIMMGLEDLGFCEKGEAAGFIADGHIDPGGSLPYNTNGGYLWFGQAGISCGMDSIVELIRQLRGQALGRQVEAEVGLVHGMGGPLSCHTVTILATES
jgi:acetyl-CoA acetyltransferase